MNVVLVTGIFPPDIGGPATYVPRIAEALAARGHGVKVIAASDSVQHHGDRSYPFPVLRIARCPRWRRMAAVVGEVRRAARGADVILANSMHLECLLAAWLARRPVILKIAGDWAWERSRSRNWITDDFETFQRRRYSPRVELLRTIRAWVARRADGLLAPSQYLGRWAKAWGARPERIQVIYNSIDAADGGRHTAAVPRPGSPTLLTVGRLVPWKHVDALIEILPQLDGVGLVVAGEGELREALERRASELGVAGRVHFAGKRSRQEVLDWMAACDVFVLNSSYEGLPHVVLEAMQMGIPVIAAAAGGTVELVEDGETGTLVPPGDTPSLAKAVRGVLASPELRARHVKNAAARLHRFGFKTMLLQTERLLLRAAGRSAP